MAPQPLLVVGSVEEWKELSSAVWESAAVTMPLSGRAGIAGVVGTAPPYLQGNLELFDLIAIGSTDMVAARLEDWLRGFRQYPQACTVTALLLRQPEHDLVLESLAYSALQAGPEHARWLESRRAQAITDDSTRVTATADGDYREVLLTRPDRHNAFDSRMREELCDAFDALAMEDHTAIGLRGAGPTFCSGGDLAEFGTRVDPVHAHIVRTSRSVARRLQQMSARIVAGVQGTCMGAGIELPAFAGWLIASPDATFQLPEAGFGLLPGAGGTVSIKSRIGRHGLLDLIVTGHRIDARTALSWGLVDEIVDQEELPACVRSRAYALLKPS